MLVITSYSIHYTKLYENGAAVDGDERLVGPPAVGVDEAGDELFAGPALPHDQDR